MERGTFRAGPFGQHLDLRAQARHPGGPDPRETQPLRKVRDMYAPDLHLDSLPLKARDFR
jgi:hypothetical protein